jgi:hypothetical protein
VPTSAPALFDDPDERRDAAAIAVLGSFTGPRRTMTIGLSRPGRADGPVALVTASPRLGRHASSALGQVATLVAARPDALEASHQVAIEPLSAAGLTGVAPWSSGHLQLGAHRIALWGLRPLTADEVASFRGGQQEAWMDHVETTSAFGTLQARGSTSAP